MTETLVFVCAKDGQTKINKLKKAVQWLTHRSLLRPPRCCGHLAALLQCHPHSPPRSTTRQPPTSDYGPTCRHHARTETAKAAAKTSTSPFRNILLNDSRLRPRPASLPGGDPVGVIPLLPPQAENATLRHQSSFPRAPATSPTSLAPPSSPQKTMPEKKVLQRPSSATAHHVNGIVPDDALPPPPPAPAAAAMEEARQQRQSPPTSPRHAQTPTRASREGGHILSRSRRLATEGTAMANATPRPSPRPPQPPKGRQVDRAVVITSSEDLRALDGISTSGYANVR